MLTTNAFSEKSCVNDFVTRLSGIAEMQRLQGNDLLPWQGSRTRSSQECALACDSYEVCPGRSLADIDSAPKRCHVGGWHDLENEFRDQGARGFGSRPEFKNSSPNSCCVISLKGLSHEADCEHAHRFPWPNKPGANAPQETQRRAKTDGCNQLECC